MKKIFSILMIILTGLVTLSAQTEKLNQLFQDFEKNGGVTSINIKKPMFKLLNTLDVDNEYLAKIRPILSQVDGLKVLIIPKATFPEDLKSENSDNIRLNDLKTEKVNKALRSLNFNELMSLNSDGTSMKFLAETENGDFLENLVFNIDSNEENILFILNGKMKMSDVNKIINSTESKNSPVSNLRSNMTSETNSSYLNGETRNVGEFSGIHVSTGISLVYKQESPTSIKVIADADKLQYIVTKVENDILKVYIDNKGVKNVKFKNLSVNVSSPRMDNVKASSGASFTAVNSVRADNLDIDASSGSLIKGKFTVSNTTNVEATSGSNIKADINTGNIIIKTSSGADTFFEGQASSGSIDISSGALCKAENLRLDELEAESTSGGNLSVNVARKLKVKASSGGLVKYRGNPDIESEISKMSGGSLKPIN